MNDTLIAQAQAFTLNARAALEREADEQLQGIYGWLPDGTFAEARRYPAITQLNEARETRARVERFVEDERAAGFDAKTARRKLVRETAFTWLNRLVAFRLMEERRLIRPTIFKLDKSNGFIFWLTEEVNKDAYVLHQQGSLPLNPMGEGPSDVAYRRFLLWQCGELARDVSILFDPGTLASLLCPRPPILKQLVDDMNAEDLVEAWKAGNEEVLGWTYEGFIEEENKDVFEKFSKGKKVLPEEIGAATQRFTPRWIVRFLVENSLGRVWLEMHPNSRMAGMLTYFVPVEKKSTRQVKRVRDIDFLDPSCGSMHFGLVAFDLFVEMYREELERAGQSGWPEKASVEKMEDIPAAIVRHNLFGIDLDLRAVQISVLTIFIKARTLQPGCAVTDLNFACANMEQISGGRLDSIVSQAKFKHPIYESVLRGLVSRMKNSDQLGSLLRPEKVLQELIAAERRKAEENLLLLPGLMPDQFKTPAGLEEFFSNLSEQILQELDGMVQASRAAGQDPGHLVAEASKGLRFLRLVSRHYDVVATNPPYMSRRNMSAIIATHLDDQFNEGKGDLYAAFIIRCTELADTLGKVAMVTQQSFMFISSYEDLRAKLRASFAIEGMAHLGPRAFPNITGEKVNTTAFVFEQRPTKGECDAQEGVYFRLVREPDADSKRRAFETTLAAHSQAQSNPLVFRYVQKDFDVIPGKPWVYWIHVRLRQLFIDLPPLGDTAPVKEGINTGDNERFMRYWWEVRATDIGRKARWCRMAKGDSSVSFCNPSKYVVKNSISELRTLPGSAIRNPDFFYRAGVSFLSNSSSRFCAWVVDPDHIFCSTGGRTVFCPPDRIPFFAAILNSALTSLLLSYINPTITLKVGDVAALPLPNQDSESLAEASRHSLNLAKANIAESESCYFFRSPAAQFSDVERRSGEIEVLRRLSDAEVARLYGLTEEELAAIDRELSAHAPAEADDGDSSEDDEDDHNDLSTADWARSWISYAIGTVLGRFEIGKPGALGCGDFAAATVTAIRALVDVDGIMPCDDGHPQDIAARAVKCMALMLGDAEAREVIRNATEEAGDPVESVRQWMDRFTGTLNKSFWKYHFQLYRKRPVYWPLQSPNKTFTVWVFHERFTKNTLFDIRQHIVEPRVRLIEREIADKRREAEMNRQAAKDLDKLRDFEDDLREFSKRLKAVADRGYTPHIDDGVLLNAAPLHSLLPSWPDTKKAWDELEAGDYDWAQQAMEYWPDRVKEKCKTNKSIAIAHGLV